MNKRQQIVDTIGDLVSNFLYYDRRECEDLPVNAIEDSVSNGEISIEEIAQEFRRQLYLCFGENPDGGST